MKLRTEEKSLKSQPDLAVSLLCMSLVGVWHDPLNCTLWTSERCVEPNRQQTTPLPNFHHIDKIREFMKKFTGNFWIAWGYFMRVSSSGTVSQAVSTGPNSTKPSNRQFLAKQGWTLEKHSNSSQSIETLIGQKNEYFRIVEGKSRELLGIDLQQYRAENIRKIEAAKSAIRCLLKYMPGADALTHTIAHTVATTLLPQANYYLTRNYPLIHLPGDKSEQGGRHIDAPKYIKHYYTIWVPLNNCPGGPLSIYPGSQTAARNLIWKFQIRTPLRKVPFFNTLFSRYLRPQPQVGQYIVFNGRTQHCGNLNTTNETTVALAFSLTDQPILTAPTRHLSSTHQGLEAEPITSIPDFVHNYLKIWSELESIQGSYRHQTDFLNICELLANRISAWNLSPGEVLRLSFGLSLYAQRLDRYTDCMVFDLASVLLAQDNLGSLEKILDKLVQQSPFFFKEFCAFYSARHQSQQVSFVIRQRLARMPQFNASNFDIHMNEKLLSW